MKNIILIAFLCVSVWGFSQNDTSAVSLQPEPKFYNSFTVGVLFGGGSMVGVDFETMLGKTVGLQLGAGYLGYGAGLNFHFKPSIKSSYLSLNYWHQGLGDTFTQSLFGPAFVFRGAKGLAAQLGIAKVLEKGSAWPEGTPHPDVMLTYAIGYYIPW